MTRRVKFTSLVAFLLSVLFFFFFQTTKHNPVLVSANPFAEDPYDAVGSFGIQAAALLAILSLLRAFLPSWNRLSSENEASLVARTQLLSVLAVGVSLVADAIAMGRHRSMWIHSVGGHRLAASLGAMGVLTAAAGLLILSAAKNDAIAKRTGQPTRAICLSAVSLCTLALYPEQLRDSTVAHLFTVVVGILFLFLLMAALSVVLVPYRPEPPQPQRRIPFHHVFKRLQWPFVLVAAASMGLALGLRELGVPYERPHLSPQFFFVASIYAGLEAAGALVGYALLKRPLGIGSLFGESPKT